MKHERSVYCHFSLNIASDIGSIQIGSHFMEALGIVVYVRNHRLMSRLWSFALVPGRWFLAKLVNLPDSSRIYVG